MNKEEKKKFWHDIKWGLSWTEVMLMMIFVYSVFWALGKIFNL